MWPGLESASFFGLAPVPVSFITTYVLPSPRGSSSQVWYANHWSVSPYQPIRELGSNWWTVLWMWAPKVIQSNVTPASRSPLEASTFTSLALEYQFGQLVACTRCLQIISIGAAITMSLWAKRSASSGTIFSGQWMCTERCWMSSIIDMIVPSIMLRILGCLRSQVSAGWLHLHLEGQPLPRQIVTVGGIARPLARRANWPRSPARRPACGPPHVLVAYSV